MKSMTTRSLAKLYSWAYYKTAAWLSAEEKEVLNSPSTTPQKRFDRYLEVVLNYSVFMIPGFWQKLRKSPGLKRW